MAKITNVWARQILDSRSIPTVECMLQLDTGHIVTASAPSGASTGTYEALELRDNDPKVYHGKSVYKAVQSVNQIIGPALVQLQIDPSKQDVVDKKIIELDGTKNKTKLGANSTLAVSVATTKAGAIVNNMSLHRWVSALAKSRGIDAKPHIPTPMFNMINGGLHGAGNLDFQEFFVIPASSSQYSESLRAGVEIYQEIGKNLSRRGAIHSVGDEGGYAPNLFTNADALEILVEAIRLSNYQVGRDVFLGLDVAATTFYKDGSYTIRDKSAPMNEELMIEYYKELNDNYHLALLEDPLYEDSWQGWTQMTSKLGGQLIVVGDDLLVTHPKRVEKAIAEKACNALLAKPNQIGTVTETIDVIRMAVDAKWKVIVSHRSGETNDAFIADFAVGVGADLVKFGAPARGERVAKYNRLSAIELELAQG
ncbi:MAG: Enolase [Candidatus Woesebacteria bacterium GW2011_GWB1_43_14]|uniref:Enolase n=1 Tax=Candidatus Woesebacteria bacterium GW2011_GWB1_43_14 TaxID=1618578 RepID=A0A0G1DHR7_9BACT|nr:MAG: Enolase [Candidatus Woesebacteria bacterium GW2011_GWA1_39_11b]KKS78482.1 MAG: Enolase [Candidatus Woesebacteria bacterium GW2011_GWC1_42_9]KKS97102.1 MAG: Enolase [Candidatus Woesebacteria bacterium GW2011_GWB1_43_14]